MVYRDKVNQDTGDLLVGSRLCKVCDKVKSITEFHWTSPKHNYRRRTCKKCQHEQQMKLAKSTPERRLAKKRYSYSYKLKEYGLTLVDFDAMMEAQQGRCRICDREFDSQVKPLQPHVDHCHATGKVRGILCFTCNTGLGKFNDNVEWLRAAVLYLGG